MTSVKKIGYASYETPDLVRATEYYAAILGLTIVSRSDDRVLLASTIEPHTVVLRQGVAARCTGLGFQVGQDDDLSGLERRLVDHGVRVERRSDATPSASEMLIFDDPKGTAIEISLPPPPAERRFETRGIVPNKLGHVAFHVEDAERMTEFYCDVLGFRVSDWLDRRFSFLRCGSDHHTVNFIGSGEVRHDHSAFELRDWSHMEQACDYLSRNDYRLIWGPGRHGIGHNLFIYHKNPDGLITELYAELDTMSNESLGYFDPRPYHPDIPQRPKTWEMSPRLVNLWREEFPPPEMLEV